MKKLFDYFYRSQTIILLTIAFILETRKWTGLENEENGQ